MEFITYAMQPVIYNNGGNKYCRITRLLDLELSLCFLCSKGSFPWGEGPAGVFPLEWGTEELPLAEGQNHAPERREWMERISRLYSRVFCESTKKGINQTPRGKDNKGFTWSPMEAKREGGKSAAVKTLSSLLG